MQPDGRSQARQRSAWRASISTRKRRPTSVWANDFTASRACPREDSPRQRFGRRSHVHDRFLASARLGRLLGELGLALAVALTLDADDLSTARSEEIVGTPGDATSRWTAADWGVTALRGLLRGLRARPTTKEVLRWELLSERDWRAANRTVLMGSFGRDWKASRPAGQDAAEHAGGDDGRNVQDLRPHVEEPRGPE